MKAILRFKLDQSFPTEESTSFEAMSKFSGLSVMNVRRIVRHAIINHHFFQENTPGVITHSALTTSLASDEGMRNSLIVELDEFWPAGVKVRPIKELKAGVLTQVDGRCSRKVAKLRREQ